MSFVSHAGAIRCLFAALALVAASIPSVRAGQEPDALTIYAVNYPLALFAERITSGMDATVVLPVPAGVDPAFWRPDALTVADFQLADLILLNGADYAKWTRRASLPLGRLVNTSEAFRDHYIEVADTVTHSHGPSGTHSHGTVAFTTWLDFNQAAQQAAAIAAAVERIRPDSRDRLKSNLERLHSELLALDRQLETLVRTVKEPPPLLASHPVYQYLARRYGLNLASVHWEPDRPPTEAEWSELKAVLERHPARWMLWEAQPMAQTVDALAALGVASVVFDPCANQPPEGDFFSVMQSNIDHLKPIFRQ